jgi:hypothetical protein
VTRYRLIEALGGAEVQVMHGFARDDGRLDVHVPGVVDGAFTVPKHALIVVKPPLPPEPPLLSVVLDRDNVAWQRCLDFVDRPWFSATGPDSDWPTLNRDHGPLTLLVPDRFSAPPELPWTGESIYGTKIEVLPADFGHVNLAVRQSDCNVAASFRPDRARELANVLWAAADQAEATP